MPRKSVSNAARLGRTTRTAARGREIPCSRSQDCLIAQAVAGLSVGLVLIDPRGRIAWLNRAAERVLGLDANRCIGRSFEDMVKDPQLAAFWRQAACREGHCLADVSLRWPAPLELKLNATQCLAPDGGEIGRALLFCDVTTDRSVQIKMTQALADRLLQLTGDEEPAALAELTPQERRVLGQVGRGLGNEGIAAEMNVAASTVRSHLKSVYRKLGFNTRAQAVRFAVSNRLT